MNEEYIKKFVQDVLGCGCPEEVFENMQYATGVSRDGVRLDARIDIGNRLLIYIMSVGDPERMETVLSRAIMAGKKERDDLGFNRFRLVLAADEPETVTQRAGEVFMHGVRDERTHLHVVKRSDAPLVGWGKGRGE